jgi:hypothetical protein
MLRSIIGVFRDFGKLDAGVFGLGRKISVETRSALTTLGMNNP